MRRDGFSDVKWLFHIRTAHVDVQVPNDTDKISLNIFKRLIKNGILRVLHVCNNFDSEELVDKIILERTFQELQSSFITLNDNYLTVIVI